MLFNDELKELNLFMYVFFLQISTLVLFGGKFMLLDPGTDFTYRQEFKTLFLLLHNPSLYFLSFLFFDSTILLRFHKGFSQYNFQKSFCYLQTNSNFRIQKLFISGRYFEMKLNQDLPDVFFWNNKCNIPSGMLELTLMNLLIFIFTIFNLKKHLASCYIRRTIASMCHCIHPNPTKIINFTTNSFSSMTNEKNTY